MKLNAKEILRPARVLFLICLITTLALAGTNLLTRDRIAEQARLEEEASRQVVLPQAAAFEAVTDLPADEAFDGMDSYYIGTTESGDAAGYIFVTTAKGYGGDIRVMTGISTSGAVTGVTILSHSETVGLGANIETDGFRSQYNQAIPDGGFTVVKSSAAGEGQISAVTGATVSSNAVTAAVNEAVSLYQAIQGGA